MIKNENTFQFNGANLANASLAQKSNSDSFRFAAVSNRSTKQNYSAAPQQTQKAAPVVTTQTAIPEFQLCLKTTSELLKIISSLLNIITRFENQFSQSNALSPTIQISISINISNNQPKQEFAAPSAKESYSRLAPANYQRADTDNLPGAREISNAVADQNGTETANANGASDLIWSWGQFIDHDLALTEESAEKSIIAVPKGDPDFDPTGTGRAFIPFTKSKQVSDASGEKQQINDQTPLMDASMMYGANKDQTDGLRSFSGGKLKSDNNFLPASNDKNLVLAGDPRAAEQPGLLSLQTLFMREHNRLADKIATDNPLLSDEKIFQQAQKMVTAEIQAITYNEFLPILIGKNPADGHHTHIGNNDGKISTEFASAAYRLGHTMVSDTVAFKKDDGTIGQASLDEVFFNPDFTSEKGIGSILAGQSEQTAEKVDPMIVDSLRNKLFGPVGSGAPGLDLASLNIERGRDHGLVSYNDMRAELGLPRIESFDDPIFQNGFGEKLASVYSSPDQIDLWVGGLAEKPTNNSMLGSTFTRIVSEQFAKTAAADANFYTREFSHSDQAWLNDLTLSDVIRANSDAQIDNTAFIATD